MPSKSLFILEFCVYPYFQSVKNDAFRYVAEMGFIQESDKRHSQDDTCLAGWENSQSTLQGEVDRASVLLDDRLAIAGSIAATGEDGRSEGRREGPAGSKKTNEKNKEITKSRRKKSCARKGTAKIYYLPQRPPRIILVIFTSTIDLTENHDRTILGNEGREGNRRELP